MADRVFTNEELREVADALNDVWAFLRTVAPIQSGLDGWHADACLIAAGLIRPKE